MTLISLSREQIKRVLGATYRYWDGYYIPQRGTGDGWTEEKVINHVIEALKEDD